MRNAVVRKKRVGEAAVEQAARVTHDAGVDLTMVGTWEERSEGVRELYREDVRTVIAALRGRL